MMVRDASSHRASSYDHTGGNVDWVIVKPGETKSFAEIAGAGCIKHFYWTYIIEKEETRKHLFRDLILRMYWDGETAASVESPIGDFFGISNATPRPIKSLGLVVNPGADSNDLSWGLNSYFPMPFAKGARIEVTNEGPVDLGIWYHIDYETYPTPPAWMNTAGRFHAQFRHERTKAYAAPKGANSDGKENYTILEATGRGSLAGYVLGVDNISGGWWGEGDDMVFIDGETWPPSFHGTGSEEIFGGGACPNVEYSGPYTGFHLVENREGDKWFGKNAMYRLFVNDPIRFDKSIRVTIEHGHADDQGNDYSSVAFWYQNEPHATFAPLPAKDERAPYVYGTDPCIEGAIEAERLLKTAEHSKDPAQGIRFPGTWSNARFLFFIANAPDDFITLRVPVESDGEYDISLYLAKASDFGVFQLKVDGKDVGAPFDAYNGAGGESPTHVVRAENVPFGSLKLPAGEHTFEFRVVGKNDRATNYYMGIDCILLKRK
ncbi:MAG: DUF2961 domain-containing protein [Candidatus Hydrogenedentes bacterium]|nr:DUF2961 domain-containing protein [Candidatus Hydrogenedentota bacterium]